MVAISAGRRRRQVTISRRVDPQDAHGQRLTQWLPHLVGIWAEIEPLKASEEVAAEIITTQISHVVTLRYRAGIRARSMRVEYQGRTFDIQSVLDPESAHKDLRLLCVEGATSGVLQ